MSNHKPSGPVHRVTPRRWTSWGEAALRLPDGREAVIWQGIPGERARVRPTGQGQHRVHGEWLSSPDPDARRRSPPCDKATLCGGCPLMHLTVPGQHDARLSMLSAAFQREGLDLEPPTTVVPSPDGDEGYRHVVKLAVGRSDRGRLRLGTYARGTHHVAPISGCKAVTPTLRRLMATVAHHSRNSTSALGSGDGRWCPSPCGAPPEPRNRAGLGDPGHRTWRSAAADAC